MDHVYRKNAFEYENFFEFNLYSVETDEKFEFFQSLLWPNQTQKQEEICKLPKLKLIGHKNVEKYRKCQLKMDWGFLKNNHWHLNNAIRTIYSKISCKYRSIERIDDFKLNYSAFMPLLDGQIVQNEVIEVECTSSNNKKKYSNLHVQIVKRNALKNIKNDESKNAQACKPMNIILLSYDSISRVSWFRRLPRTTEFLLNQMKFQILYGQSILGDGTPACLIPVYTGKMEHELPSTLKSDANGQYVDQVYPFIWNKLHDLGFTSFHIEDWPQVSTFTYRMRGMSNKTAHHYMRAFEMSLWDRVSPAYFANKDDFCIGSVKRHKRTLDLMNEFIDTYKNERNYISVMHYDENSHDGNDRASHMDNDLYDFFYHNFYNTNRFENTAIFLYSDHGSRFSVERMSEQGFIEERQPFFSVYLPESYRKAYPEKYKNLLTNAHQLTSAFDIHATLNELTCLKNEQTNKEKPLRSISLLEKLPEKRTCSDIGISLHFCVCELSWVILDKTNLLATRAVNYAIQYMNNLLTHISDYCHTLELDEVYLVKITSLNHEKYLNIKLRTKPNRANYDMFISLSNSNNDNDDEKKNGQKFYISSADSISRTNPYGSQPYCLSQIPTSRNVTVDLRKFCFCKRKL
jgi:hypothetical protein